MEDGFESAAACMLSPLNLTNFNPSAKLQLAPTILSFNEKGSHRKDAGQMQW